MSLFPEFPEDLVTSLPLPEPNGKRLFAEVLFYSINGREFLSKEEEEELLRFYECTLIGEGLFQLLPLLAQNDVKVHISDKLPKTPCAPDHPVNIYDNRILGEYYKQKETIILYVNNIREASKSEHFKDLDTKIRPVVLLLDVFAHELYHAYFHKDYYPKQSVFEEPLAELGGLIYMNNYFNGPCDSDRNRIMTALYEFVKSKEKYNLKNYSRGANMFILSTEFGWYYKLIDYYNSCNPLSPSCEDNLNSAIYEDKSIFE